MSPYIVDWDGRLFRAGGHLALADFAEDVLNLTGPIERAQKVNNTDLMLREFSISSLELSSGVTLDDPDFFRWYWYYIPPEECRIRAEQAYRTLRLSGATEIASQVCIYVDVLSLGGILNGAVI